ncbi:MAG: sensor histidine kinase [Pirellula sp.]|nr:sensor histidine kinase [Pirellula sp.]
MSLVNRLSLFFLAAITTALVGISILFYGLSRRQLEEQFDQQLYGALHLLVAAVEVESDDVKWEPSDHTIGLGIEDGLEDIRWTVFDEDERVMDHSRNLSLAKAGVDANLRDYGRRLQSDSDAAVDIDGWRVLQRRLAAAQPKPEEERDPLEREGLVVTVGRSPDDLHANLRRLGALSIVVPVAVGIVAALVARALSRRALAPLRRMADQAHDMPGTNPAARLPIPAARDELAELGTAFNALLDRLFESLDKQQRFTGDAAHQLRTPLTGLLGNVEVALRRERSADEYRETLVGVREQAEEMRRMVESLLFLARAEGEAVAPDSQSLVLDQWLPEQLRNWQPRHPSTPLQLIGLETAAARSELTVRASPALLRQVLENLIDNAVKYGAPDKPVIVALQRLGHDACISVVDQGPGIAEADRAMIFQPFFRSADARRSGAAGTGLGLAVAARIARALGGSLECTSRPGSGAKFTLKLPLCS